ncbi:hypothetical protein BRC68_13990 [Halobacteriales archaeon QH_6_64_20]|nr:MAG: hypothetical protein BRC68_13990 [Halobacteriales archaeon QH_6_64_20]
MGGMNNSSSLRVAHMSPDAPNVDVYVNNETFLENVSFGTISNYSSVPPGEYAVRITAAGNESAVVFDDNVTLEAGAYTLAATIADNVTFGNATDYVEVPPGSYTLDIRATTEDNTGPIMASYDVSVEGGTAYSAFAAGYVTPATNRLRCRSTSSSQPTGRPTPRCRTGT